MTSTGSGMPNRWTIAWTGVVLQLCLGTVYAWSFFQKPLISSYGWTNVQAIWGLSLAIFFLGLAAAWGGLQLSRVGPRMLAVPGAVMYGAGYLVAAAGLHTGSMALFYLGFGVLGGIGLGLGYVTPVATAAKWFPDKKGLVTGMVVMGFGLGALLMSTVLGPGLMALFAKDLVKVFLCIGVFVLVVAVPAACLLRNPPAMSAATASGAAPQPAAGDECGNAGALRAQFARMWLMFFFNITAGITFIGFQSPMLQDLLKADRKEAMSDGALAAAGATLIAISSLFNGLGRFLWGGVSDKVGRVAAFRMILGSQVLVFAALPFVTHPVLFGAMVCYVLLCYGGGFGTMPSFVLDVFGPKRMAFVYGCMLTAWSAAGVAGPQIAAYIKDRHAGHAFVYTFAVGGIMLAAGFIVSLFTREAGREPR